MMISVKALEIGIDRDLLPLETFDTMRDLEIARSITCIIRVVMMRWRKIVQ